MYAVGLAYAPSALVQLPAVEPDRKYRNFQTHPLTRVWIKHMRARTNPFLHTHKTQRERERERAREKGRERERVRAKRQEGLMSEKTKCIL